MRQGTTCASAKASWRKAFATLAAVALVAGVMGVAVVGCAPQGGTGKADAPKQSAEQPASGQAANPATDASGESETKAAVDTPGSTQAVTMKDYRNMSSGLFPDTKDNTEWLNTGNRGCNACHDDLYDVMMMQEPKHIVSKFGFGKKLAVNDCLPCHDSHTSRCAPYFGDIMHAKHYGSIMFTEGGGNCWSCHAMNSAGALGEYQFMLFDHLMYMDDLGGFIDGSTDPNQWWLKSRGYESGYRTGITTEGAPTLDVAIDQPVTEEDDMFIIENYGTTEVDIDKWTLDFTEGVNNPRSFTLDELKAMPQTEITATQACFTNGVNGVLACNIPIKGVKLSYLIEQCGGLVDGVNSIHTDSGDWEPWFQDHSWEVIEAVDPIVALEYFGHPLDAHQGYPATMVYPGLSGGPWQKYLTTVSFKTVEVPNEAQRNFPKLFGNPEGPTRADGSTLIFPVNSAFFDNDGIEAKVGQELTLSGYSWSWAQYAGTLTTIEFSDDYGRNWTEVEVPASFDPNQWVRWDLKWTPSEPGTHILHVKGISDMYEQSVPSSIIIEVAE